MSTRRTTPRAEAHKWEFQARFRRHAFGWKSQPAIQRVKQAVSEIKKVARRDPVLAAEGGVLFLERVSPAIELAEASRGPWTSAADVDALCEAMLLSSGLVEEAYARYGLRANRAGTYLATFRAVAKKYPHKQPEQLLADLVESTPGDEGKWFAAAKELGLYDAAIQLARASPCDPKTLARAARDHADEQPAFAVEAGLAALDWLVQGFGYEITGGDVWMAYSATMKAAETLGRAAETQERIRHLASGGCSFVAEVRGRELGLRR